MKKLITDRLKNNGNAVFPLNEVQQHYIKQVRHKIEKGIYSFEDVPCAICGSTDFDIVAEKDRYGFELTLAICQKCGLVQTNPRMNQDAYNQFYDQEYRFVYGGEESPSPAFFNDQYNRLGKKIFQFIAKNLSLPSLVGKFVLEVGCGAGGILKFFKDHGCSVKGIDLGSQYVSYGRDVHGLDLEVMTLENLRLERKPDIIIYSHVLEHILDLQGQLERLKAVMGPDTILYIEVPGLRNLHKSYETDLALYLQNAHVYHFTRVTLQNLMEKNNFETLTIDDFVRSIFKKRATSANFVMESEYPHIINYLRRVELVRQISPIPVYKYKFFLKRFIYNTLAVFKVVKPLTEKSS